MAHLICVMIMISFSEPSTMASGKTDLSAVCSCVSDSLGRTRETAASKMKDEPLSFKERWSIKTNALEWLLTIPNLSTEFDLSRSPDNCMTLGLGVKINWNTWHRYKPSCVFNMFDIRPQYRYYFRTNSRSDPDQSGKSGKQKFLEYMVDHERKSPKSWRACYVGAYANYGTFAFKFGKEGIQGYDFGIGAVLGYSLPLYTYKKGCIDIDFGFSFGFQMTKYDRFIHNSNGYYYEMLEGRGKPLHFTPYPIVSELSVAFAYRFKSVKDKYPYSSQEKKQRQIAREDKAYARDQEIKQKKFLKDSTALADSLARVEVLKVKEAERLDKEKERKEKLELEQRISKMSPEEYEEYRKEQKAVSAQLKAQKAQARKEEQQLKEEEKAKEKEKKRKKD